MELLDIFHEIMIAYIIRSMILWPKKIENRNMLNKVYSILFSKIANIRILIAQKLDPYSDNQFEDYATSRMHMTRSLLKHKDIFKDLNMELDSEKLMDSIWNIHEECIREAFPEPLIYGWEFDYKNDGWRKLIQLQMQHPEQQNSCHLQEKSVMDQHLHAHSAWVYGLQEYLTIPIDSVQGQRRLLCSFQSLMLDKNTRQNPLQHRHRSF